MDTQSRLKLLATMADGEQGGLKESLRMFCPDWIPAKGDPGTPNREYTATKDPRWRKVSILVGNIIARKPVETAAILRLAELFDTESDTEPKKAATQTGHGPDTDRTQKNNSTKKRRSWDANCQRMAKAYIRQCKKDGKQIARIQFITEELSRNGTNYPNAKSEATIDKAFQLNPDEWKPALSDALSGPDTDRTH